MMMIFFSEPRRACLYQYAKIDGVKTHYFSFSEGPAQDIDSQSQMRPQLEKC
jgi:hypothetical protein